jgi:hypothetical protein
LETRLRSGIIDAARTVSNFSIYIYIYVYMRVGQVWNRAVRYREAEHKVGDGRGAKGGKEEGRDETRVRPFDEQTT